MVSRGDVSEYKVERFLEVETKGAAVVGDDKVMFEDVVSTERRVLESSEEVPTDKMIRFPKVVFMEEVVETTKTLA